MRGYQQEDGTITPPGDGRFYRTGDVAERDADGHLSYVGRADDVFKASDYRISPFELESVLIEHPQVIEAAVVPAPDAVRMNVPKAFLVLSPGINDERSVMLSIFRHLRERLAPFKRPRRLEVIELPKTISGKIRRVELRQLEERRFQTAERAPTEYREEDFPELR
jgi:acetyl-CoA synthetase